MAAVSRQRWKWGLTAVMLIALGIGAGVWAGLVSDNTVPVAVLSEDLPAGHVLTGADLGSVEIHEAEGLHFLSPEAAEGMRLTRPVPSGFPLVSGSVTDRTSWPEPDQAVVSVPVAALPQAVGSGVDVALITAAPTTDEAAEDDEDSADDEPGVVPGIVHRVAPAAENGFDGGQQVVEVVVPRNQAARISRAVAGDGVQIALVNASEDVHPDASEEESE
ncbi:SAF domain-containing protein [Nocardiopsis sp. EMB25]|uniref:SAF domain-containing protein n=1 Tax=Nocardiopsis sp. EMB25 TaxID=2835867 RepID=UPI002283B082|nr:SAF domain-containing protein [Nocardiopsis sp. EMB25]MCY9787112.1 SAF domain-containing protein [Nocardiopsis sp. EMB25]